jgi:hypothetical protein
MADLLDRTARQVRLPGGTIHQVTGMPYTVPGMGRHYRTRCRRTLTGQAGAVLTTRKAGCELCANPNGKADQSLVIVVQDET